MLQKNVPSDCHQITSTTSPKSYHLITSISANVQYKLPSHPRKKTGNVCRSKISAAQTPNVQAHNDSSVAGDPVASRSRGGLEKRPHLCIGASCNKLVVYKLWFANSAIRLFSLAGILPQTQSRFDPLQLFVFASSLQAIRLRVCRQSWRIREGDTDLPGHLWSSTKLFPLFFCRVKWANTTGYWRASLYAVQCLVHLAKNSCSIYRIWHIFGQSWQNLLSKTWVLRAMRPSFSIKARTVPSRRWLF